MRRAWPRKIAENTKRTAVITGREKAQKAQKGTRRFGFLHLSRLLSFFAAIPASRPSRPRKNATKTVSSGREKAQQAQEVGEAVSSRSLLRLLRLFAAIPTFLPSPSLRSLRSVRSVAAILTAPVMCPSQ